MISFGIIIWSKHVILNKDIVREKKIFLNNKMILFLITFTWQTLMLVYILNIVKESDNLVMKTRHWNSYKNVL